ncbi:MAG TPA: hypothetical protein VJ824_13030 [Bacillota bacterium]|nr:hypothetical protein [Bacillota bacterium]
MKQRQMIYHSFDCWITPTMRAVISSRLLAIKVMTTDHNGGD